MKRTLDHDNLIGWRRRDQDLALSLEEGDPVVITTSSNGHDASAKILTSFSETVTIPKNFWFTAESLGRRSVVLLLGEDAEEELAEQEWYPKPRSSNGAKKN